MRFIDAHVHAFPDAATGRAWRGPASDDLKRTGVIPELISLMTEGGIERAVILLFHRTQEAYDRAIAAGDPPGEARKSAVAGMREYNRWGCELASRDSRFVAFVGMNPRFLSAAELSREIADAHAAGARGVKIIPPRIEAYGNDPLFWPIYQACSNLGMPVLSQAGRGNEAPGEGPDPFGRPKYFADALAAFPKLKLILAHLGRDFEDDVAALTHRFPNVYTDTSIRLSGLGKPGNWTPQAFVDQIRRIGSERVLFGTNYPFVNPAVYALILQQLPLTKDELRGIACENFERVASA